MEYREFRAEGVASEEGKLTGLVTPFDRETTIGDLKRGGWKETVKSGFFTKTLREADYLLVYQHDMTKPMARRSAGNLTFAEGERDGQRGLVMDADPVDTSYTRDCLSLVRAKVINGMSFGFNVIKDAWFDDKGNPSDRFNGTRRELLEGHLIEGSPVTRPAYGGTAISARDESSALLEARQRAADEERAPKPYGNVKYADAKNGKYPIDTLKHIKAAWAYINVARNAAKYPLNGVSLSSVKAKIKAAAKAAGVKVSASMREADLAGYCPRHGFEDCDTRCKNPQTYEERVKKSVAKRIVQMKAELGQAMDLFTSAGIDDLPKDAQSAIALVSAALTHTGHMSKKENLKGSDAARSEQKPDTSTSANDTENAALLARARLAQERSRELGL